MAAKSLTAQLENLPKIVKVLVFFFLGAAVSGIYRVIRYTETKNLVTLVAGILCFFTCGIMGLVDAITELLYNKVTLFAE